MLSNVVRCGPPPLRCCRPKTTTPILLTSPPPLAVCVTSETRTKRTRSCSSHASQPRQLRGACHSRSGGDSSQVLKLVGAPERERDTEGGRKATPALDTNIKTGENTDRAEASETGLFTQCPQRVYWYFHVLIVLWKNFTDGDNDLLPRMARLTLAGMQPPAHLHRVISCLYRLLSSRCVNTSIALIFWEWCPCKYCLRDGFFPPTRKRIGTRCRMCRIVVRHLFFFFYYWRGSKQSSDAHVWHVSAAALSKKHSPWSKDDCARVILLVVLASS